MSIATVGMKCSPMQLWFARCRMIEQTLVAEKTIYVDICAAIEAGQVEVDGAILTGATFAEYMCSALDECKEVVRRCGEGLVCLRNQFTSPAIVGLHAVVPIFLAELSEQSSKLGRALSISSSSSARDASYGPARHGKRGTVKPYAPRLSPSTLAPAVLTLVEPATVEIRARKLPILSIRMRTRPVVSRPVRIVVTSPEDEATWQPVEPVVQDRRYLQVRSPR